MKKILPRIKSQLAFTMIELLIVIAILGILAVAVLAAINPVEQINRGRDTGTRSDAEQLLSAIDRYYAYKGYHPWQTSPNDAGALAWRGVSGDSQITHGETTIPAWMEIGDACSVLDKLSNGNADGSCDGTNEIKRSFVTKVTENDYNHLFVYAQGRSGDSVYVCFEPQSEGFKDEASTRCGENGAGLPADIAADTRPVICDDANDTYFVCLP